MRDYSHRLKREGTNDRSVEVVVLLGLGDERHDGVIHDGDGMVGHVR